MSETLTPNNFSVFHPIKLTFGTFVEPILDAVNRIARALSGAKHSINNPFFAYSSQRKAPSVLQIYAHAQIINVYKRKGLSRDSRQDALLKKGPQIYIAPYGILGGKS